MASVILLVFIGSSLPGVSSKPLWQSTSADDGPTITIQVKDAFYFDADDDGLVDDTFASVELFISGVNRINFDYYLTLTLPSGEYFLFGLGINTRYSYLELNTTMHHTALEPGWYHLNVEIVTKTGGVSYQNFEHIFDPPGGTTGGKPYSDTLVSGY